MKLFDTFNPKDDPKINYIPLRILKMFQATASKFNPPDRFNSLRVLVDADGKFENLELFWDEDEAKSSSTILMSSGADLHFAGDK